MPSLNREWICSQCPQKQKGNSGKHCYNERLCIYSPICIIHKDLTEKLTALETKYNKQFKDVYEALAYLLNKDKQEIVQRKRRRIGFKTGQKA